jgi:hypothetical protein
MSNIDKEEFNRNLLLTQLYCERQLPDNDMPVAEVLRSFNPEYKGHQFFSFNRFNRWGISKRLAETVWSIDPILENENLYTDLFIKQLIHKQNVIQINGQKTSDNGKILVAEIDCVIRDGASEDESDGFIDCNDCPPIDTWFYLSENRRGRLLYAWIPDQFVKLVDNAIDVNMLSIFLWLEDFMADNRHL